jgi:hypothetical protein
VGLGTLTGALIAGASFITDPRLGSVAASLELTSSILSAGVLVLTTNNAYISMYSSNFAMNIQGGPRNVALAATSTLTLPDLALGTATPASGYLCAVPTGQVVGHGIKSADGYGAMADCGYPMSDPSVTTLTTSGDATVGGILRMSVSTSQIIPGTAAWGVTNHAATAYGIYINDAGVVTLRNSLLIGGDVGAGTALNLTLTNGTGIGNGANTNMQAPLKGTGGGPASAVLVTDWIKIYDGATTKWIPAFT